METTNIPQPAAGGKSAKVILTVVVLAILLALALWLAYKKPAAKPAVIPGTANQPTQDLGSTLYQNASNPVSGKLPSTVAPTPNPVQGLYKNPF